MKKRMIAMVLSIVMVIGILPTTVFAADVVASGYCGGEGDGTNLTWNLDNAGVLTISGTGAMKKWELSDTVPWNDYKNSILEIIISEGITNVGSYGFTSCQKLTKVDFPTTIKTIDEGAFGYCISLGNVIINEGVTTIGEGAFQRCTNLSDVTLPSTLSVIGVSAFDNCTKLDNITLPNSLEVIEFCAFNDCTALETITIPASVYRIVHNAFSSCTSMQKIEVDDENEYYTDDGYGVLYTKDFSILVQYPIGNDRSNYTVTSNTQYIEEWAFAENSYIQTVILPDTLIEIDNYAFYGCNKLTGIELPQSLSTLGDAAFRDCSNLKNIILPESLKGKLSTTFSGCSSLESIIVPSKIEELSFYAFGDCTSLKNVIITSPVIDIRGYNFSDCINLESISIYASDPIMASADEFENCRSLQSAYFYGNAPVQYNLSPITSKMFGDTASSFTIYYKEGTTGWTDSEAYDAEAGTWNGYKLAVWEDDSSDEDDNITYTRFGQYNGSTLNYVIDPVTGFGKNLMETVTIDGNTYDFADTCEQQSIYKPTNYLGDFYYIAYNLNEHNEVSAAEIMSGITCTLEGYDPITKVVDTDYTPIIPVGEDRALPSGSFYVSDVTASSFPSDEISNWVGDQVRIYCVGEQIFKVIHITALTGNVTSFDALNSPQKVYIDNIAYAIVENDSSLVEQCRTNQFSDVISVLYDGVVVQLISVDDAIELQVALGLGSNSRVRYSNGTYQRSLPDKTNKITVKVSLSISEYLDYPIDRLKGMIQYDVFINEIEINSLSNGISFAGSNTIKLSIPSDKQLLTAGESFSFSTSFNFNNSYVPYNNEEFRIHCEVSGTQDKNDVSEYANASFTVITKESDTSESTGGREDDAELQEAISENKDDLKISGSFAWDSLFKTNILTDAQADQIKYAIMSAVASTTLPEDTFDDYVAENVLSQFCQYQNYGLEVENINVTVPIRIDTKDYGELIVNLTYSGPSFFISKISFGSFISINYEIVSGKNIDKIKIPLSGFAGGGTIYNLKSFAQAVENIAKAEVKSAVKLPSGIGVARKITEISEFKELVWATTAMDVIKTVGEAKDIKYTGWEIITYPMKTVKFDCPIDIYVYDDSKALLAQVINDIGKSFNDKIIVDVRGGAKFFTIIGEDDYSFEIKATANGTMDITVDEMAGFERSMRTIVYYDLPLTVGDAYEASTNHKLLTDTPFTLTRDGYIVAPDEDVKHTSSLDDSEPCLCSVTYTDGVDGEEVFADQTFEVEKGFATPAFIGIPTRSGYTFIGWNPAVSATVTGNQVYTATWEKTSTGGVIIPTEFSINIKDSDNGKVEASVKYAVPGSTVKLTVTPDEGYELDTLSVKSDRKEIDVTEKNGKYQFTMPYGSVNVTATFKAVNPYNDVDTDDWFYDDVLLVTAKELMEGTGNSKFSPDISADRAMIVTILWRQEGCPVVDSPVDFDDVADGLWYSEAIDWASSNGIVNGYGDGNYGPTNQITREQIMAILNRYAVYKNWTDDIALPMIPQYNCSTWAENNVIWADMSGLLNGLGVDITDMTAKASRAELAAYLSRFVQNVVK